MLSLCIYSHSLQFISVQSLSHVWLFVTPWIAALQASLSITNSPSLLKLTSIESVMPQSLPASESFPMSQLFTSGSQSRGTSASVFPVNIQDWFPLRLTDLISLHPQCDFYYSSTLDDIFQITWKIPTSKYGVIVSSVQITAPFWVD